MKKEVDDWLLATVIMLVLSLMTFITQRFFVRILDPVFETCVFYIPTTVLFLVYVRLRLKAKATR